MMYPRLKLLQKLLTEDGVIFISIDDTEYANLKLICDEIFGSNCFVSNISWQRTYSTRNDSKGIVNEVEHLLVYSKQPDWNPNKLPRTAEMDERYKNPDNDVRPWKSSDAFAPDSVGHQGMVYGVQHPITGKIMYPPNGRHWSFGQEQVLEIMQGWAPYELRDINDAEVRAELCGIAKESVRQDVKAIMLSVPLEEAAKQAEQVYQRGQWPVFCFSNNGKGGIRRKTYLTEVGGRLPTNFWAFTETGHTDEAKKEMLAIFDGKATFDTPKPHRLIEFVLKIAGSDNALVLDSFAGSGTTAHAVLNMNKADGGHRKFILVEMMDYADSITAERVKRVIQGYGAGKTGVEGTGGNFSFYDLGEPLLVGDCLNEAVAPEKIREYIWFMETKTPYAPPAGDNPYYLGKHNSAGYYFYYEPQRVTVLDYAFLATIKEKADGTVIYADRCSIGEDKLAQMGITFKKIPRDISRL
jgi:adenine-specific DNA-methyltransferase